MSERETQTQTQTQGNIKYKIVREHIEKFLSENGHTDPEHSASSRKIVDELTKTLGKRSSYFAHLNQAANTDPESPVQSAGRTKGYFYQKDKQQKKGGKTKSEFTLLEKHLYPLVEAWLQQGAGTGSEYKETQTVANARGNGPWGNPDIVAKKQTRFAGAVEIELVSCEVKRDIVAWEKFFFEAVSHKRFAHRSWYCVRIDARSSLPKRELMVQYAERYRVGIATIELSEKECERLVRLKDETLQDWAAEKIHVVHSAPFDPVPLSEVRQFCENSDLDAWIE